MIARKHIPNLLTWSRVAVIPLMVTVWLTAYDCLALAPLILFAYAALSDFLDGYLARKWQVESAIGRMLDPIADKLLVATALILLLSSGHAELIPIICIIFREIFISGVREAVADKNVILHVTFLAKCKTATQMLACFILLFAYGYGDGTITMIGNGVLWIATALTLITGWQYFRAALKSL